MSTEQKREAIWRRPKLVSSATDKVHCGQLQSSSVSSLELLSSSPLLHSPGQVFVRGPSEPGAARFDLALGERWENQRQQVVVVCRAAKSTEPSDAADLDNYQLIRSHCNRWRRRRRQRRPREQVALPLVRVPFLGHCSSSNCCILYHPKLVAVAISVSSFAWPAGSIGAADCAPRGGGGSRAGVNHKQVAGPRGHSPPTRPTMAGPRGRADLLERPDTFLAGR